MHPCLHNTLIIQQQLEIPKSVGIPSCGDARTNLTSTAGVKQINISVPLFFGISSQYTMHPDDTFQPLIYPFIAKNTRNPCCDKRVTDRLMDQLTDGHKLFQRCEKVFLIGDNLTVDLSNSFLYIMCFPVCSIYILLSSVHLLPSVHYIC